jgi:hypothetical protein
LTCCNWLSKHALLVRQGIGREVVARNNCLFTIARLTVNIYTSGFKYIHTILKTSEFAHKYGNKYSTYSMHTHYYSDLMYGGVCKMGIQSKALQQVNDEP